MKLHTSTCASASHHHGSHGYDVLGAKLSVANFARSGFSPFLAQDLGSVPKSVKEGLFRGEGASKGS